jgi:hypothetical protein
MVFCETLIWHIFRNIEEISKFPIIIIYKRMNENVEFVCDCQLAEQVEEREIRKATSVRDRFVIEQSPAF